jgi:hypothetical protein
MEILNAIDLRNGKKAEQNKFGSLTQPIQFLPDKEKDHFWMANNADYWENQGIKQLNRNARKLLKNYKLVKGIIDRSDYIPQENNEYNDVLQVISRADEDSAMELKFYPIIPNVYNTLLSEFAKRNTDVTYHAVDPVSTNELINQKAADVERSLIQQASVKVMSKLIEQGLDPRDEMFQQAMSPEQIKSLPEIQEFYAKDYRSAAEIWAQHQHNVDVERFKMDELEYSAFGDMLATDREFWHFKMGDDDYAVELWNPILTFYIKSPDTRYISQGHVVGNITMMSIADVIDKYGYLMDEDQLKSLESLYPTKSAAYNIGGLANDGSFYDATKSHEWNTNRPSLEYRQMVSGMDNFIGQGSDILTWILGESEDFLDFGTADLLRVSTIYWKSQRRVGHLTKIGDDGEPVIDIVGEDYIVTDKPLYDTSLFTEKSRDNLVYGEHIDWIWINDVYGVVKIGPKTSTYADNSGQLSPIYLGIDKKKPGRLRFQFKGDSNLYGVKLPVEGAVFSDRNTRSTCFVDLMKPHQISYNMVNNQMADILVDEIGTVIALDQNAIPRKSLGDDWGKNNFGKFYSVMKDFSIAPFDTSITNTENSLAFQHYQTLDMSQTERLLSRVQLANYFKQQAYEVIGITPQRLGMETGRETATGVEQNLNASYAQTEKYFIQHSDHLMPRVHQMRTDLAQFYHSSKPSVQLTYTTSMSEKVNFQIHGTDLLLPQLNVFCTTKYNTRSLIDRLKEMSVQNNTTGASIYDLGRVLKAKSMAEVDVALKGIDEKFRAEAQAERDHELEMEKQRLEAEAREKAEQRAFEASEAQKDREKDILEAEIKSAGYGAMQDVDGNGVSDYNDSLDRIQRSEEYQQTMNMNQQKLTNDQLKHNDKMNLEREKLAAQRDTNNTNFMIAKENQTRAEIESRRKERMQKKKKK